MQAEATIDIAALPWDVDALIAVVVEQRREYSAALESLRRQLHKLRQMTFGSSSQRFTRQTLLCSEALPIPPELPQQVCTRVESHERKRCGRPPLRACPACARTTT